MKIFVTGCSGTIGKEFLKAGSSESAYQIIPIQRNDLENRNFFKKFKTTQDCLLLHLAWPVRASDYINSKDNIDFLELSKDFIIRYKTELENSRIIGIGTYFELGQFGNFSNSSEPNPQNLYSECKLNLQQWLFSEFKEVSFWYRLANVISENDPNWKLVGSSLRATKVYNLKYGNRHVDFIHAEDVAKALWYLIKSSMSPKLLMIGTGRTLSTLELVTEILKNRKIEINIEDITFGCCNLDVSELFEIGWRPSYVSASELAARIIGGARSQVSQL